MVLSQFILILYRTFSHCSYEGPGVPEERLPELTEPFMRLESSRARHTGGVGLGLSIVEALAHRFGGTLRLENRQEGGLRAVLTLPDADAVT